jgi:tryptophanyl-tRNA synthetase
VGDLHSIFSQPDPRDPAKTDVNSFIREGCRTAAIGCERCKMLAGLSIHETIGPMQQYREELERKPDAVWAALEAGTRNATQAAETVMKQVRSVMGISRDLSGIRLHSSPLDPARTDPRDLTNLRDWWDLDSPLLTRNLREIWRSEIAPSDLSMRQESDGTWVTPNGRRLFVAAAAQQPQEAAWLLAAKPKSYEFLVLLCWGSDSRLRDFVLPQKLYIAPWVAAKRAAGKEDVKFSVQHRDGRYLLHLPFADPIDITETEARYGVI